LRVDWKASHVTVDVALPRSLRVSLIYFHRFLIVCFILFSLYFAWHMFRMWAGDLVTSIFFLLVAIGFSLYVRTVRARPKKDSHQAHLSP
jgi:hypothetical protein